MTGAEGSVTLVDLAGSEHRIDTLPLLRSAREFSVGLRLQARIWMSDPRSNIACKNSVSS